MPRVPFRRLLALLFCLGACGHSGGGSPADAGLPEGGDGDAPFLDGTTDVDATDLDVERTDANADDHDGPLDLPDPDSGGAGDVLPDEASVDRASKDGEGSDTSVSDAGGPDAPSPCGPCMEQWVCGGVVPAVLVTLMPVADECHLSGLSGNKLLQPDGTITENGVVVGSIMRTSARVRVVYPDGGQWLYCASPPICTPWP